MQCSKQLNMLRVSGLVGAGAGKVRVVVRGRNDLGRYRRRGAVAAMVAVGTVALLGLAALSVDLGMLYTARGDLQRTADSAAMAGAMELLDTDRLKGSPNLTNEMTASRSAARAYVQSNPVLGVGIDIGLNPANSSNGDLVLGYLANPDNTNESLSLVDPTSYNSVQVRVRRDNTQNGSIGLLFARVLGFNEGNVFADATATFKDGVVGYQVNGQTGNADLLPFALHVDAWTSLLDGSLGPPDDFEFDGGVVVAGSDEIHEVNLYPGGGVGQLPPGNFGTVDIGAANNSSADIARQIVEGVNQADLAYFGGKLMLGSDGTLMLNGDTGLSAGFKDELESIKGKPRSIPLFDQVSGNGNNSQYRIVGFAGIRIMDVKLTGAMNKKRLVIQPAFVVDDAAITGPGSGSSYFVYEPVRIVR